MMTSLAWQMRLPMRVTSALIMPRLLAACEKMCPAVRAKSAAAAFSLRVAAASMKTSYLFDATRSAITHSDSNIRFAAVTAVMPVGS